jgi:hypothetical protein
MALTYQEEKFIDVMEECGPLIVSHWKEVALDQDSIELEPDWDAYNLLDCSGHLHITTVRDDGVLVGYAVYIINRALHYASQRYADGDIFWLDQQYRKGFTGIKLLKFAEEFLVGVGVTKIFNKTKLHMDKGAVFERLGYTPIERVYAKAVG